MLRATAHGALFGVAVTSPPTHPRAARDDSRVQAPQRRQQQQEKHLLQAIAVIFLVLWLLGFVTSYTMGGFIHILLAVAIVMVLPGVIQRPARAVTG